MRQRPRHCNSSSNTRAQPGPTGASGSWPGRRHCSRWARPPTSCTGRRSSGSAARDSPYTWPVPTWCTASGCAVSSVARMPGSTCASLTTAWATWARRRSPSGLAKSSSRPERQRGGGRWRRVTSSPHKKRRSPSWLPAGSRSTRSAASCSSVITPWNGISARCSPSWPSRRADSSPRP